SMGREIGALIYAIPWNGDIPNHYTFGDIYEGAEGNVIGLLVWHVLTHLIPPTEYEHFWVGLVHTHPMNDYGFSEQDMELANGESFTIRGTPFKFPNPFGPMPVYMALRYINKKVNYDQIDVKKYTPNSGQSNLGEMIWP
ncbi:MAG: hypothetical protein FWF15_04455, partial [Oscillospiraceae bacterium]|nr:hypothetical protein [Oscillospiraceae bacterium]